MDTVGGIRVDELAEWGEPFLHSGRLLRTAWPTPLWALMARRHPRILRAAGVLTRTSAGGTTFLVQYLEAPPEPLPRAKPFAAVDTSRVQVSHDGLLSWQPESVKRLKFFWQHGQRNLADLSDTGTGKSYVFLALCRELHRQAFVICPKNSIEQWRQAAADLGTKLYLAVNYEALKSRRCSFSVTWEPTRQGWWPVWAVDPWNTLLCFDEVQGCKSPHGTLNSKLLLGAIAQQLPLVLLSATLATSPVYLRAAGYALGLHHNHDFPAWLRAHGCLQNGSRWVFNNSREILRRIHAELFARCAVRVRKADLGERFPSTVIEAWLMEFPDGVARSYRRLQLLLAAHRRQSSAGVGNALAALQGSRQEVELCKVPAVVEMAREFAAEGLAVVCFFNFDAPLNEAARLLDHCPVISGRHTADRRAVQLAFQRDELPFLCCNIDAGGEAISLHGRRERGALIMPTDKADKLRQVLGRVQRAGGARSVQRILFAKGTVEERSHERVRLKLDNLDLLNDGDTLGNLIFSHE